HAIPSSNSTSTRLPHGSFPSDMRFSLLTTGRGRARRRNRGGRPAHGKVPRPVCSRPPRAFCCTLWSCSRRRLAAYGKRDPITVPVGARGRKRWGREKHDTHGVSSCTWEWLEAESIHGGESEGSRRFGIPRAEIRAL